MEDEEHCGADIFQCSNIRILNDGAMVTLGGNGEGLGACQSACAVVRVEKGLSTQDFNVIDGQDGASGLLKISETAFLLDCVGSEYIVDLG